MRPLDAYRRTQADLRSLFGPFTEELCPTCPEPCCRVPARVTPLDVAIAEACGWRCSIPEITDAASTAASQLFRAVSSSEQSESPVPCPFLTPTGCDLPGNVRPYGCTVYVCRFINDRLSARERARLRKLLRQLERDYERILQSFGRRRGRSAKGYGSELCGEGGSTRP